MFIFRPFDGEFLISALLRTSNFLGLHSRKNFFNFWWGENFIKYQLFLDIPPNLDRLSRRHNIPQNVLDTLIQNHTLRSFYTPFLKREQIKRLDKHIHGNIERRPNYISNVMQSKYLRFCPTCLSENKKESYWNILHQIPGILFCHIHDEPILDSNYSNFITNLTKHSPANINIKNLKHPPILNKLTTKDREFLNYLERDIVFLLNSNYSSTISWEGLVSRYQTECIRQELASVRGKVKKNEFAQILLSTYSKNLLKALGCEISPNANNWLPKLGELQSMQPSKFLLVIHALGFNFQNFLDAPIQHNFLGESSWPCLNPVCINYMDLVIDEAQATYSPSMCIIIGEFKCRCGFCYKRYLIPHDPHKQNIFHYNSVVDYGHVFKEKLAKAWRSQNKNIAQIANEFSMSRKHLQKLAVNWGLPSSPSRSNLRELKPSQKLWAKGNSRLLDIDEEKKKFLQVRKEHPEATIHELRSLGLTSNIKFLTQNDREWFEKNYQTLKWSQKHPALKAANLINQDSIMAEKLLAASTTICNISQKPDTRISRRFLSKYCCIPYDSLSPQKLNTFPVAQAFYLALEENNDQFIKRKYSWIICKYHVTLPITETIKSLQSRLKLGEQLRNKKKLAIFQEICRRAYPNFNYSTILESFYYLEPRDWEQYDIEMSAKVLETADSIKNTRGYPLKVTASNLSYKLNAVEELIKSPYRLPKTWKRITDCLENDEIYGIRVVKWAKDYFTNKKQCPDYSQFIKYACLTDYEQFLPVKKAVESTLDELSVYLNDQIISIAKIPASLRNKIKKDRDHLLSKEVVEAGEEIRQIVPLLEVTKSQIGIWLDENKPLLWSKKIYITSGKKDIPECLQALENIVESRLDFILRLYTHRSFVFRMFCRESIPKLYGLIDPLCEICKIDNIVGSQFHKNDHNKIDHFLAGTVFLAAGMCLMFNPPKQISLSYTIMKLLRFTQPQLLDDVAPKTTEAIKHVLETTEDFGKRNLIYLAIQNIPEQIDFTNTPPHIVSYLQHNVSWEETDELLCRALMELSKLPSMQNHKGTPILKKINKRMEIWRIDRNYGNNLPQFRQLKSELSRK